LRPLWNNRNVKRFVLTAAALFLAGCAKDIQNKQALKDGVVEYLNARLPETGLDVRLMDVDVSAMTFERDQARATVVFRPKSSPESQPMTMNYSFDRKGDKWVVHGRQDSGANPHGAGGLPAPGAAANPGALPPGHPPTSGAPQPGTLPPGHPPTGAQQ
jgi:hypothetical protein